MFETNSCNFDELYFFSVLLLIDFYNRKNRCEEGWKRWFWISSQRSPLQQVTTLNGCFLSFRKRWVQTRTGCFFRMKGRPLMDFPVEVGTRSWRLWPRTQRLSGIRRRDVMRRAFVIRDEDRRARSWRGAGGSSLAQDDNHRHQRRNNHASSSGAEDVVDRQTRQPVLHRQNGAACEGHNGLFIRGL